MATNRALRKRRNNQLTTNIAAETPQAVNDSFQNFTTNVGSHVNNAWSQGTHQFNNITKNRLELDRLHTSSWIVGMAIDAPAEDMCRAGLELQGDIDNKIKEQIHASIQDLQIWQSIARCEKWGNLYGGALGYIMIDGHNPSTPLNISSIGKNQFRGIYPMDRWMVTLDLGETVTELGPDYGLPMFYNVFAMINGKQVVTNKIHYTRIIRFTGIDVSFQQTQTEMGWGKSQLERISDLVSAFENTTLNMAGLVDKANLRIMSVKGLREMIANGGPTRDYFAAQMQMLKTFQVNESVTISDIDDKWESMQYNFSGLDQVVLQFAQQISGALQIPLVRLLGQSPAGLNSTGESDLRTYYDNLAKKQEIDLRRPFTKILDIIAQSVTGAPLPVGFTFKFKPLWLLTENDKAEISSKTAATIVSVFSAGLIDKKTALEELKHLSTTTGTFMNINIEELINTPIEEEDNAE